MSKVSTFFKRSYIMLILLIVYAPLLTAAIFSFNQAPKRGDVSFNVWNGFSWQGFIELSEKHILMAIVNSIVIGVIVAIVVVIVSLLTVYGLWRQKQKVYKLFVDSTANIPLINPDIVSAVALAITFGLFFGTLGLLDSGMWRAIIAHIVVILPYGIIIMYPRSSKFDKSLLEASYDLGYGPMRSWFKTYFRHMWPVIVASFVIALTLSFDDFILTRITSKVETTGVILYSSNIKNWVLMLGTILLIITVGSSVFYALWKGRKSERG